jgi:hypothetical protein
MNNDNNKHDKKPVNPDGKKVEFGNEFDAAKDAKQQPKDCR